MKCFLAALLTVYSSLAFATDIVIRNAYIPLMPPASKVYAAYLTISNAGEQSRTVVGVSADGFAMAHIHKSMMSNDVASMHSLDELNVSAGETVSMVPGRIHVMLMNPNGDFTKGDTVKLELMFSDGEVATVNAKLGKLN